MHIFSGWDKIDVCVKLLVDDVWESDNDETGFFSVVFDSLIGLFRKNANSLSGGAN